MAKPDSSDNPNSPKTLRERAEQLLRTKPADMPTMATEDVQALVHELQVHQMELEFQNEELRQAQVDLTESRDRYSDLYEFAPVGYVIMDVFGQIIAANLRVASLLYVDRQDLVGAKLSDLIQPDSQDDWFLHHRAVFAGKRKESCELAMRTGNGTLFWARVESTLHQSIFGGEPECRTALVDITEKKLAEEALQKLNIDLGASLENQTAELTERVAEVKLLTEAVANLGEGVLITDDDLDWPGPHIVFVNDAMCRITGYEREELIGQSPRILQGDDSNRDELDRIKAELSAGRSCAAELVSHRKDGTAYNAELVITPLFDADGKRTNFVSVHRDVTERNRIQDALRESEERFRLFMDNSPTVAWMKDEQGRYVYLSKTHEQRFNVRLEDWRGKTDFDIWPREIAEQYHKHDQEVLDGNKVVETVEQASNPDGTLSDWWVFKFPFVDSRGNRFAAGIATDVTERKRAREALQGSEERLRAILNTAADAIITIDRDGIITGVNPATERLFGYTQDELNGRNVKILMPPPYCNEHDGYIARYLETGEPRLIGNGRELVGRRKDGSTFPVGVSVSVAEELGIFTGIVRDLTERNAAQARLLQAERLALLGEAMAGLTHESRNALARSQANLRQLARRLKGDDEALRFIEGALGANDDIRRQFEEVRDYAAPVQMHPEPIELPKIVHAAWDELADDRADRDAQLTLNETDLDLTCEVDRYSLRHALRNILENSLAAGTDPIAIDIAFAEAHIEGRPALQMVIRDNGPGLAPDVTPRAFDAFFTTKTRGTGLGLAIVKRSVEAHGGVVKFNAGESRGAEIIITLPRSQS